ncbi:MAG: hypothetical protein ABSE49_31460, partial [Polyangiaceae bacterium]
MLPRALLASCLLPLVALAACEATPPPVTPPPPPPPAATATGIAPGPAPTAPVATAEAPSGYDKPPANILDVMHAPSPPQPFASPTHDTILLVSWQDYPPMTRVAAPFLRLAGVRIEP